MPGLEQRRYKISEVSELTEVPAHVLRQWEKRFSKLRPKRDRAGRRYYLSGDIEMVRTIKSLLRHEGMTVKGAERYIRQKEHEGARPRSRAEALRLIERIEAEVHAMLNKLKQRP